MNMRTIFAGLMGIVAGLLLAITGSAFAQAADMQGYPYTFGSPQAIGNIITGSAATAPATGTIAPTVVTPAANSTATSTASGTPGVSLPAGNTTTLNVMQSAATYPLPLITQIDGSGTAVVRGVVQSVGTGNSFTLAGWGGTWIIRPTGTANISPAGTSAGDISSLSVGDYVGVAGTVDTTEGFTIQASVIHDWTKTGVPSATATSTQGLLELQESTPSFNPSTTFFNFSLFSPATTSLQSASQTVFNGTVRSVNGATGTINFVDSAGAPRMLVLTPDLVMQNSAGRTVNLSTIEPGDQVTVVGALQGQYLYGTVVRDTSR